MKINAAIEETAQDLYIPIWFYSNRAKIEALDPTSDFTFQSGSIQIKSKIDSVELGKLYIPIWFYSN